MVIFVYIFAGDAMVATITSGGSATGSTTPSCMPPTTGDWVISTSCTFTGTAIAPQSVIVNAGKQLTLAPDSKLLIDFKHYKLLVKKTGGVLIKKTAALRQVKNDDLFAPQAIYYQHTDHLTGQAVTTDKNGNIVELMDYYPYGSSRLDERSDSFNEQRKFAGYERDNSTGLDYVGARYYNSANGNFLSEDPSFLAMGDNERFRQIIKQELQQFLSNPQNLNSYSYALGNPLIYIDPDGNLPIRQYWNSYIQGVRNVENAIGSGISLGWNATVNFSKAVTDARLQWQADHPQETEALFMIVGGINFSPEEIKIGGVSSPLNGSRLFDPVAQQKAWLEGVENPSAQNLIKDVFRSKDTMSGGTIGALQKELETGELTGSKSHLIKAQETLNRINNIESSQKLNSTEQNRLNTIKDSIKALLNK